MTIVLSVKQAGKSRPLHPNCPPGVLSISFIVKTADRPQPNCRKKTASEGVNENFLFDEPKRIIRLGEELKFS
jgi:hypothetical protein